MKKLDTDAIYLDVSNYWHFTGKYDFVDKWFLMQNPYPILALTAMYLLFVLKLGPEYLKNRKPLELKMVLVVYNAIQVGISAIMVYLAIELLYDVGLFPQTCVPDNQEKLHRMISTGYCYFLCKITELLDTIFFVLRKKGNQVTFLHVYHHTMMVLNGWFYTKYEPGAFMVVLGLLNCFVHVLMYGYYGLSAFPSLHKYLWWKKYITTMQLAQFFLVIVHLTVSLVVCECKPSTWTIVYFYLNGVLFIYLFLSFYFKTYSKAYKKIENDINNKESSLKNGSHYKEGLFTNKFNDHKNCSENDLEVKNVSSEIRKRI